MNTLKLRACFVGSKNPFNEVLVHWLSRRVDLVAVVWTTSVDWQNTWRGRLRFAWQRCRRYGLWKTIDEILFFLYYHGVLNRRSEEEVRESIIGPYRKRHGVCRWQGDALSTDNVNSDAVREFLQQRNPEVGFAMCTNDYFGKRLRSILKHGLFLWHEGITPEYKGLYAPFWAVHNLDFDRIGYTLLRMNDAYDAGEIFVQGRASEIDPFHHTHDYMGHKAILDSLPEVERFITALGNGTARAVDRPDAQSGSYTYPGITDLVRQRRKLRKHRS